MQHHATVQYKKNKQAHVKRSHMLTSGWVNVIIAICIFYRCYFINMENKCEKEKHIPKGSITTTEFADTTGKFISFYQKQLNGCVQRYTV